MGAFAALGLGLLGGAAGAFLGGRAGDITRQRLTDAANLPGVDTGALTGQALSQQQQYLPQATALAGQLGTANQAQLMAQEGSALGPGGSAALMQARNAQLGAAQSLFGTDAQYLQQLQRQGAALGLSSGLMGSQAGQLQTLNLTAQQNQQRYQVGAGLLGSLLGGIKIANTPGAQAFLGPNPSQLIAIRSQERAQQQQLLAKAAGVPGQTAAWGSYLSNLGGTLTGAGALGALGGGMGGGMTGNPGGMTNPYESPYGYGVAATTSPYGNNTLYSQP